MHALIATELVTNITYIIIYLKILNHNSEKDIIFAKKIKYLVVLETIEFCLNILIVRKGLCKCR